MYSRTVLHKAIIIGSPNNTKQLIQAFDCDATNFNPMINITGFDVYTSNSSKYKNNTFWHLSIAPRFKTQLEKQLIGASLVIILEDSSLDMNHIHSIMPLIKNANITCIKFNIEARPVRELINCFDMQLTSSNSDVAKTNHDASTDIDIDQIISESVTISPVKTKRAVNLPVTQTPYNLFIKARGYLLDQSAELTHREDNEIGGIVFLHSNNKL